MRKPTWFTQHGAKFATVALLAIPPTLFPFLDDSAANENRRMAPPPQLPTNWAQFLDLPLQTDAWVKDHFSFRQNLIIANNRLRYRLFHEFPSVHMSAGENGRYFLTAHTNGAQPYSAVTSICEVDQATRNAFGAYLNVMFDSFEAMGYSPKLMIAPSAPVVHSNDLPVWLRDRCSGSTPMASVLQDTGLNSKVKASIYYPLEQMRARNHNADLFPKHWFHWNGAGLESIADGSMQRLFPAVKATAPRLLTHATERYSDVAQFFPGIGLRSMVTEPDYLASKITSCQGRTCIPEFKEFSEKLYDTSSFHNPAAPDRRLLIISDSFGQYISGWYARYYRDVEHFSAGNVKDLKREQVKAVIEFLLREPGRTDILFLYHDGALNGSLRFGLEPFLRNGEGGPGETHGPNDYNTLAQQLYVIFLGRPADVDGLNSLRRQLAEATAPFDLQQFNLATDAKLRKLITSFANSAESMALYPGDSGAFISAVYRQLFNRQPDAGGLRYWKQQLDEGQLDRGRAILAIAAAALIDNSTQGRIDGELLRKKVVYGSLFTSALVKTKRQCYSGAAAAGMARTQITAVKFDTDVHRSKIEAAKMSDAACD